MSWIALIDTTGHTPDAPPGHVVAGLSLVERAVRLAAVSGCGRAVLITHTGEADAVGALAARVRLDIQTEVLEVPPGPAAHAVARAAQDTVPGAVRGVLLLRSSTVYDRGLIHAHPATKSEAGDFLVAPSDLHGQPADVLEVSAGRWGEFVEACARVLAQNDTDNRSDDATDPFGALRTATQATVQPTQKWQVRVADKHSAWHAADALWRGCRKPVDGIVSRLLNRYISLAISRRIAHTGIHPNHVSIVTFSLGIIAALFAAQGGYVWFVLAGLAYQANSVIDGVDGELARVKYEFSLLGEWLDTLSDDLKDVLFYAGLGVGAWRTFPFPGALTPEIWLWLGGVAVAGKLVSMTAYYSWLIAHKRGDLLAFEWSFEHRAPGEETLMSRALTIVKYATKNDFIVFFAMLMAFVGALPWFLFIVAPGQFVIALSVLLQRLQPTRGDDR